MSDAVGIEEVLEHTLNGLGRAIQESSAEIMHNPLPTVMAGRAQLAQVFQNLIANGIKSRRSPRVHARRSGRATSGYFR